MLPYSVAIVAYSQQVFGMKDLFGTYVNCTVGILDTILLEKKALQIEVGYLLLNVS